ncbi:MAG: hypothetical protein JWQ36_580 [Enterovirga sp.]|jgi:hypothetical protein|nr:hypothetical protein [Enterovirga sp.]
MPRFYFDIYDGNRDSRDEEGSEFPDLKTACDEAVAVLPTIAGSSVWASGEIVATVRDADGTARFRACLSVRSEMLDAAEPGPA